MMREPSSHHAHAAHAGGGERAGHASSPYRSLAVMTLLSFVVMYCLMYSMVDALGNVYMSLNQVYMAGVMAAPMVLIEIVAMRAMYPDRRRNALFAGGAAVAAIAFFLLIRGQTAIGDRQFLRSMIPHHAGAILMCRRAPIHDDAIRGLCQSIISSQQAEIDQMKAMLSRSR